jgi:hypothetical protein
MINKQIQGLLEQANPQLARILDQQEAQKAMEARMRPTQYGATPMGMFLTAASGAQGAMREGARNVVSNVTGTEQAQGQYAKMYQQQQMQYAKQFGEVAKFVASVDFLTEDEKKRYISSMSPRNKLMTPQEVYAQLMEKSQEEAEFDTFIQLDSDGRASGAPFTGKMSNGRVFDSQGNLVKGAVKTTDLNEPTVDLAKDYARRQQTDEILGVAPTPTQEANQANQAVEQAGQNTIKPVSPEQARKEGLGKFSLFGIKEENFGRYEPASLKRVASMLVTPEEFAKMSSEEKGAYVTNINKELTVREESFTKEQRELRSEYASKARQYNDFKSGSEVFWNNIDNAITGFGAEFKLGGLKAVDFFTGGLLGVEDTIASTELLGSEQGKILLNMAEQMKGALSNADMQFLKDVAMTIGNSKEALKVGFAILEAKKLTDASVNHYITNTLNGDLHRLDEAKVRRQAGEENLKRVLKSRGVDPKYFGMYQGYVLGE